MKQLTRYLRTYVSEYYHPGLYLSVALLLVASIAFNYAVNFENSIIDSYFGSWWRWPMYFATMAFPFLITCVFLHLFGLQTTWWRSKEYWFLFVIGFAIISFQRSFSFFDFIVGDMHRYDRLFTLKVIYKARSILFTTLPLLLFYYFYERKRDEQRSWYGLNFKPFDFRPYAVLILVVFVGIAIASFLGDLTNYYPRYLRTGGERFARLHDLPSWIPVLTYESIYGLGFLGVEFFFRGFLVIGFSRILGGHAVIAMVGSYVFLHFGKPISECISSAFGGYLIGILAYYSRHIWGGVVLHVALAWFMELFAWLQKVFND
ncbi:CPBP family intramembrane glutamic endopeptidase [Reichenbachiella ulvae]|uniref:CPBP family intramembrane metalloprotease n=1 Tax=Reichenbachiella ulvae TaxID=2980104 RepID=A0ABT3CTS4_9BACT|nr:CPBP family intramembrane glutamic endopeptidase [Reichenbachiella ulvae]MCV9387102.1 CPBP family intramembrane metalloprotease [Reichenbachiella ulvae]